MDGSSVILTHMVIKAVIFDLGGVLLRTQDFSVREALAERLSMDRHELEEFVFGGESGDRAQRGEVSAQQHGENLRYQLGYSPQEFQAFLDEFFASDRIDEQLVDYIRVLRKKYKTALLSNSADDLRQKISEKWHIQDAFDLLIISAEVGAAKPDPRIFRFTLDQLGIPAGETIFVDDFQRNVDAAAEMGIHAIRFISPQQICEELDRLLNGNIRGT